MEDRWDEQVSTDVLSGDVCYFCLKPTGLGDKLCDNGKADNPCSLSFHAGCYQHHLDETKLFKKCICRHCAVCGAALRSNCVGNCTLCSANMHLDCAYKPNFYCVVCHHAVWPLEA